MNGRINPGLQDNIAIAQALKGNNFDIVSMLLDDRITLRVSQIRKIRIHVSYNYPITITV